MKNGDYYRWRYKKIDTGKRGLTDELLYWCKSKIAVFKLGRLRDTYWDFCGARDVSWTEAEAVRDLDLEFVANASELEEQRNRQDPLSERYRRSDIVDLTHPNGGTLFLRKGAEPDCDTERATWKRKRDEAQSDADHYARMLDREATP